MNSIETNVAITLHLVLQLIQQVKLHGKVGDEGKTQVMYGVLFEETDNIFEALSGLLITAKKHKVRAAVNVYQTIEAVNVSLFGSTLGNLLLRYQNWSMTPKPKSS